MVRGNNMNGETVDFKEYSMHADDMLNTESNWFYVCLIVLDGQGSPAVIRSSPETLVART